MASHYYPNVDFKELANQKYGTWRLPNSFQEVVDFAVHFNGHAQPLVHDYPWSIPIVAILSYWLIVYFGPKFMATRNKYELKFVSVIWNFFLFALSVGMFLGMIGEAADFLYRKGFYEMVCMPNGELYVGLPFFCIWLFALSKYIELFDTVILILRKKKPSFLHWYHHTTVLAYTWFSMVILSPPGAIFGVVNTAVHTVMYFYYLCYEIGLKPRWGRFVTIIQIIQMIIGIITSTFWAYYYLSDAKCPMYYPDIYFTSTLLLYLSYFILFYSFYRERYHKTSPTSQPHTPATPQPKQQPATGSKKRN